jgi:hypothetical protein
MEDPVTAKAEDTCPSGSACARVTVQLGNGMTGERQVCLPRCTPSSTENPCQKYASGLSCDPLSILLTGHTEICILPSCAQDKDCGNRSDFNPDSTCHLVTGVCFSRGTPGVPIGAPCQLASDCGPKQVCYKKTAEGAIPGGYCTIIGCDNGGLWQCPEMSACFGIGSAQSVNICLRTGCDPNAPDATDGCRDETSAGAYECVASGDDSLCWIKPQ